MSDPEAASEPAASETTAIDPAESEAADPPTDLRADPTADARADPPTDLRADPRADPTTDPTTNPTADPTDTESARNPQTAFWAFLESLCGQAFEGRLVESEPPDPSLEGQRMVMHVRACSDDEIRVPFHVGEDRSRTWVFTRTPEGLRLKHDHRHADGSEDDLTQYGGDTPDRGTAVVQEFHADEATAVMLPEAATNVWTVELRPGGRFAYALRREDADRRFRAEFDLTRPVPEPPAPWGG